MVATSKKSFPEIIAGFREMTGVPSETTDEELLQTKLTPFKFPIGGVTITVEFGDLTVEELLRNLEKLQR